MKQKIAIIAGGDSGEYEISIKSAGVVKKHLDSAKFECFIIVIRGRNWFCHDNDGTVFPVNKEDFSVSLPGRALSFDAVFVAIHGTPGEDGKIQGYFDLLGIPYTSCDQATSALTFDKFFCNHYVSSFGVKISRSIVLNKNEKISEDEILKRISLPFFVKPNCGGSSVGTSKVKKREELIPALTLAFHEDSRVLLEEHIPGRELSCGTIKYKGAIRTLPITEILSKKEFFDYEAKYEGMSDEVTPADVPGEIARMISDTSLKLYKLLNCKGIVRFDFILNDKELYFLEVNTVPGLSELSIVPQQALRAGISLQDLFSEAVMNALNDR
ncbi:MAG: D-alanine--D-alanine ligase [Bacteroidales bacterium]|nr:D-alanine--D-alanine ligase [Bacteroidales bacterium]